METTQTMDGSVTGAVRAWLKIEGVAVLAVSVLLYWHYGPSWWWFWALLLTPDLFMLPYLINPRVGAISYNVVHSYFLPLGAASVALIFHYDAMLPFLFIWTAHIGMDRAMGYGLKYPTAFSRTHLGSK